MGHRMHMRGFVRVVTPVTTHGELWAVSRTAYRARVLVVAAPVA